MSLRPLYMWAGGKTRLLKHYRQVWPPMDEFDAYVEPFFGGGAVFAWVHSIDPDLPAVLGDVNWELVGVLHAIKTAPQRFLADVKKLTDEYFSLPTEKQARKAWYYTQRERYWEDPTPPRLFVLMRLSFNGIWQDCKESNGLFATPAGLLNHKHPDQVYREEMVLAWSQALARAELHACDYRDLPIPSGRVLIYLDPPYRDSFTTYGTGFDDDDQKQLAFWFRERIAEGATCLLSNRCVEGDTFFEDLLGDVATFHYFDVTYTAGRRKATSSGFQAKQAREFLAISKHRHLVSPHRTAPGL